MSQLLSAFLVLLFAPLSFANESVIKPTSIKVEFATGEIFEGDYICDTEYCI
jgi:hypothetical protein